MKKNPKKDKNKMQEKINILLSWILMNNCVN